MYSGHLVFSLADVLPVSLQSVLSAAVPSLTLSSVRGHQVRTALVRALPSCFSARCCPFPKYTGHLAL